MTVAEAFKAAKASGQPVVVGSMLGESRTVEVTPTGSFVATEHLRPVRARVGGKWQAIDASLVGKDGAYVPRSSTVGLRISAGGDGPLVSMTRGGRTVSFSWPGTLPVPVIDGDTAVFKSVLPDVDLIVRADADGFRHLFRVNTAAAAADPKVAKLTLGVSAPQMRLSQDSTGLLRAVDAGGGGALFQAPQPLMWDSAGIAAGAGASGADAMTESATDPLDGPPEGSAVASVGVQVGSTSLALTPDQGILGSSKTVYPVYVDPVWKTVTRSEWAMVSSGFPNESYWEFKGNSTEGVGFCDVSWDYDCYKDQIKRVMFRLPVGAYSGKYIMSATFTAYNTSSYSCSTDRRVDLWHVGSFSSSTTWSSDSWISYLANRSVSYCSKTPVEFTGTALKDLVQSYANSGYSTLSFGLKAYDESTMSYWKRFADDAALRVEYNVAPPEPKTADLTSSPGGACSGPSSPKYVAMLPEMQAYLRNNDTDEKLFAQFAVGWDHDGDGSVSEQWRSPDPEPGSTTGFKTPPALFKRTIPSTIGLPENELAYWKVRAWDGKQWSPWSTAGSQTGCYFIVDTSVPAAPVISSPEYPESIAGDETDPWSDGVGRYGTFRTAASTGIAKVWFGLNGDPTSANERTADGTGAASIPFAPERPGLNFVTAKAFNAAGTASAIATYYFRVKAGSGPVAHWTLDDPVNSTTAADSANGANTYPATTHGVTLEVDGVDRTAMQVTDNPGGYASTSAKVLDTSKSFAVSVWVRIPVKPTHAMIIATQAGTSKSGFELYYSSTYDRWVFNRYSTDSDSATIVRAMSSTSPAWGRWTHLVGVYDSVMGTIRLYVNGGKDVVTTPFTFTAWDATGPVQLGAGSYGGTHSSFFNGEIDDVRLYNRILTGDEARVLFTQHPDVAARWKLNDDSSGVTLPSPTVYYKLDEAAGASRAEDTMGTYPAGAHYVTFGQTGKVGKAAGFDGSRSYAATTGTVLDTAKSFSVVAWAKLPTARPTHAGIIATQAGINRSGFELYYSSAYDRWIFNRYDADTTTAGIVRAQSEAVPKLDTWTHLVGVYDAENKQIRLYVDGALQQTTPYSNGWSAGGKLQLGAGWYGGLGSYFTGSLDDVRVYGQALTGSQATYLAQGSPSGSFSADESLNGHFVTLHGAKTDPGSVIVGSGALSLDGVDDYAETTRPAVATNDSFTITTWVYANGVPTRDAAIVSQAGAVNSGFTVRYSPSVNGGAGGYRIEMPNKDATDAVSQTADHWENQIGGGGWDHITITYDAFTATMSLYVNGQLYESDANVSVRENTEAFNATGPLQIGRTKAGGSFGEYWPGVIDDVWVFQGVATECDIAKLATPYTEYPTYGLDATPCS